MEDALRGSLRGSTAFDQFDATECQVTIVGDGANGKVRRIAGNYCRRLGGQSCLLDALIENHAVRPMETVT